MRTVEAEVLREGLRDERLEAAPDEVARGGRVRIRVARREALIREVDHREQLTLLRAPHTFTLMYRIWAVYSTLYE